MAGSISLRAKTLVGASAAVPVDSFVPLPEPGTVAVTLVPLEPD